jgi:Flp pilus assembly protein TadG
MRRLRTLRSFRGSEEGSMALEFALMAPILVLLAVAIVDVSGAANRQMQLVGAVRAGAQLAVVRPPAPATLHEIEAAVRGTAPEADGDSRVVVVELFCERADGARVTCGTEAAGEAAYVSIDVTESWSPTFSHALVGRPVPLAARQIVRVR